MAVAPDLLIASHQWRFFGDDVWAFVALIFVKA